MVGSGTRKARAISSVERPPRRRKVSAARASADSSGWHETKINRSMSSPTGSSSLASTSGTASASRASISRVSSPSFR
jgi:hypothetical protein